MNRAKESFQLSENAAADYENQKVKSMFRPLAAAMLDRIGIDEHDVILDLACGTGIVARTVAEKSKLHNPIAGVDLNENMIAMARNVTAHEADKFDWHVSGAEQIPFPDQTFTLVLCQQGIQYFPDEGKVLSEVRRVTSDGGRIVISVWAGASDFFVAMADSVSRRIDAETGRKYLAPFSYQRVEQLPSMLKDSGFQSVSVETVTVDRTMEEIEVSIEKEILGHPAGPAVAAAGQETVDGVGRDVITACAGYRLGPHMIVPQEAFLISAEAG